MPRSPSLTGIALFFGLYAYSLPYYLLFSFRTVEQINILYAKQASSNGNLTVEPVNVDGLTLLKVNKFSSLGFARCFVQCLLELKET